SMAQLIELQAECRKCFVDPALIQYAVKLVGATRDPARYGVPEVARYLQYGASPRASIHLIQGARALGFLRGRDYVLPQDAVDLVPGVARHRVVLSYEAMADNVTADQIIQRLMQQISPPDRVLESHVRVPA